MAGELVLLHTDQLTLSIRYDGKYKDISDEGTSEFRVRCQDNCRLNIYGTDHSTDRTLSIYSCAPMFFEQRSYLLTVRSKNGQHVQVAHDNESIQSKMHSLAGDETIQHGSINFANDIGLSEFTILLNGLEYLRFTVEVFPSKISYREDYLAMLDDITQELFNLIFDTPRKTFREFGQSSLSDSTPTIFYSILRTIYDDFIRAADTVLRQPHHVLETTHEVLPAHKVHRTDGRTIRWLQKHPEQVMAVQGGYRMERALAVKKQVTYDTAENRMAKYMLQRTAGRLAQVTDRFRRETSSGKALLSGMENMQNGILRRCHSGVLAQVEAKGISGSMSLVFSMARGYRELYKCYLMLQRGLSMTGDLFHMSIKDVATLYEYWCFIKLNSLLAKKYKRVSRGPIKIDRKGITIDLKKGNPSEVHYDDPNGGDRISLRYNPTYRDLPTGAKKPDNVLELTKKDGGIPYSYVFDAKYKIDPAEPGSYYYNNIAQTPGPQDKDIYTMHHYRDAIVSQSDMSPHQRKMFGCYVLFPYQKEKEYEAHPFYRSIDSMNIGGLPFLPNHTMLVEKLLDELIGDSPESAFERATLPMGIESRLSRVDWSVRDVLVGFVPSPDQLERCLGANETSRCFYYLPASQLEKHLPIHTVALYNSFKGFAGMEQEPGIHMYGRVTECERIRRRDITEAAPSRRWPGDTEFYRITVEKWLPLPHSFSPLRGQHDSFFTNEFLLQHGSTVSDLQAVNSDDSYRFAYELNRHLNLSQTLNPDESVSDAPALGDDLSHSGFRFHNSVVRIADSNIYIEQDSIEQYHCSLTDYRKNPIEEFRRLYQQACEGKKI